MTDGIWTPAEDETPDYVGWEREGMPLLAPASWGSAWLDEPPTMIDLQLERLNSADCAIAHYADMAATGDHDGGRDFYVGWSGARWDFEAELREMLLLLGGGC